ncbi:hypothetical protein EMPG_10867 [Blastomyces silverae]|uniref:Aminoglycoside phosphotransferase domain-containing protein n=1 Tax=Blastomyces silverae TaxID=2060906 RepID=A0A0H1B3M8_9EURO|nr:hypothetical protein EMPG_10867 [Blastomyces silverae]
MLERLAQSDDDDIEPAIYYEAGPFVGPRDFLFCLLSLNKAKQPTHEIGIGMLKLLHLFLQWAPAPQDPKFVLTHPDLNMQNILVFEDGSMRALIDWDDVAAVPCLVGNKKYPSWLTRDWDPSIINLRLT